jgi:hypothetical protein
MQILAQAFPTIAVAIIYCLWHRVHMINLRRGQVLRERVAYMLWCAATEAD